MVSPAVPFIGSAVALQATEGVSQGFWPSVVTGISLDANYWRSMYISQVGKFVPMVSWDAIQMRSQDCPPLFHLNYGVMSARNSDLQKHGGFLTVPGLHVMVVPEQTDVDYEEDLDE